jgi:hypothetical protein
MRRWRLVPTVLLVLAFSSARTAQAQLSPTALPPLEDRHDDLDGLNGREPTGAGETQSPTVATATTGTAGGGADFKGAFEDSIRWLLIQHAVRVTTEEKTRRELKGPFFGDYRRSVRVPPQWQDGDSGLTNYVLHPGQGAASGFIWLQNTPTGQMPFALTREYMTSRLWATVWAAGYSLQFEIGPLSEASIGNVGMNPETTGWVDHVMTPAGGLVIMMAEDMLDRFVVRKLEDRTSSGVMRAMLRMFLTPSRATANVSGMRAPWYRAGRPLTH